MEGGIVAECGVGGGVWGEFVDQCGVGEGGVDEVGGGGKAVERGDQATVGIGGGKIVRRARITKEFLSKGRRAGVTVGGEYNQRDKSQAEACGANVMNMPLIQAPPYARRRSAPYICATIQTSESREIIRSAATQSVLLQNLCKSSRLRLDVTKICRSLL